MGVFATGRGTQFFPVGCLDIPPFSRHTHLYKRSILDKIEVVHLHTKLKIQRYKARAKRG